MALADLVDRRLHGLGVAAGRQGRERIAQVPQGRPFAGVRRAIGLGRLHHVAVVGERAAHQIVEDGRGPRRRLGRVAGDEAPEDGGVLRVADARQVEEDAVAEPRLGRGRRPGVDVPGRVFEPLRRALPGEFREMRQVVVDVAGDHVEMEPLRPPGRGVHVERERLARAVGEPFLDGQAVAAGFRDLLAVLIEEELVDESGRRRRAEDATDAAGERDRIDQVLARHFVVDAQGMPAHRPVGLPLELAAPAGDRDGRRLACGIDVAHGARVLVAPDDRHLQHPTRLRAERQERAPGRPPLRAQGGQDDAHDRVVMAEHVQKRRIERA